MKNSFLRLVLTGVFCSLLNPVQAVLLPVTEDTSSTITAKIDQATGKAVTLSVTSKQEAFLIFDLSSLPLSVTASNITSARLNLYVSSMAVAGELTVHLVTNEWRENTPTVDAPGYSSEVVGTIPAASLAAKSFIEVDVTSAVSNWFDGGTNYGFAIVAASGNVRLGSKEGLGTGFPALLEIDTLNAGQVNVSQLTNGILPLSGLPDAVVTNYETGVTLGGAFSGNGSGLTLLNPAALSAGTAAIDISGNAATAATAIHFTGSLSGDVTGTQGATAVLTSGGNAIVTNNETGVTLGGAFSGDGSGLTNLNVRASQVAGLPNLRQVALLKWGASTADNTFSVGQFPYAVCFDGSSIWVANSADNTVTKLNPITGASIGTYSVGSDPQAICFDGSNIWVGNTGGNNVTQLNAGTGATIGTYNVGSEPFALCFDGAGIWVANLFGNNVTKLNASTGATIGTYSVGTGPDGICFDGSSIWVANAAGNNVTKLNPSTGATIGTYSVGSEPQGICFDGASIWVANYSGNTLTKL